MKGARTLFAALALAVLLIILEPSVNAVVHRLTPTLTRRPTSSKGRMAPLDRLAAHHAADWTFAQQRLVQQQMKIADDSCSSDSDEPCVDIRVGPYQDWYDTFTAEMYIGSPEQGPFKMELSFRPHSTYVLKKGAKYDGTPETTDESKVEEVQEYDKKASNTSQKMKNAVFTPFYLFLNGSVVNDVIQLGSVSINQDLQVTKWVDIDFEYYGFDGALGLGVSDARDNSSFAEQLASQLDSPDLALHTYQEYTDVASWNHSGVLSFGDRLPEICDASSWISPEMPVDLSGWPSVPIVLVTGPADSDGCENKFRANMTLDFVNAFGSIFCSYQLQELFVQASGARWNSTSKLYVVDDVSKAVPVKFHTASGVVVEVTPYDYLIEANGIHTLYVYAFYDQHHYGYDYIFLGQNFMNNHCLSMDMTTGVWSLGSVKNPSEAKTNSPIVVS